MAEWHDAASLRARWTNAPANTDELEELLEVAKDQCLTFAPLPTATVSPTAGTNDAQPPTRYRVAQRMQVQALWEAQKAAPTGEIGGEGYGVRIYDMGATIKRVLRPVSATEGLVG